MVVYLVLGVMWGFIIGVWLVPVIRQRISCEIYEAIGLGLCFSILILGSGGVGKQLNYFPLKIIGFALFVPATFFTISAFVALKNQGKPTDHWESTTVLISSSIFQIVRHPMYLGTAIFAVAFTLIFPSLVSLVLGIISIFCCWMAAKKEDVFNTEKFGASYLEYMEKVPMWNAFQGLRRRNT